MASPRMHNPLDQIVYRHQCRDWEENDYTKGLGDTLEALFDQQKHSLEDILAGLNESKIRPEGHDVWTEDVFRAEMARLGA